MEAAVNYAAGQGALLVAAAGNTAPAGVAYPAAYPAVLAVAATDRNDQRAYYSNMGPEVALAAPGGLTNQLIYSTWPAGLRCSTTAPAGSCTAIGTSMSAAFVTGAAALIWGLRPDLTADGVKAILLETARATGAPAQEVGAGRLDVYAAVRRALVSDLRLSRSQVSHLLATHSPVLTESVTLSNPSSEPLTWEATPSGGTGWLALQGEGGQNPGGSIRYGQPAQLTFTISPTHLAAGNYHGDIAITGRRANSSSVVLKLPVTVQVRTALNQVYLPRAAVNSIEEPWQTPDGDGSQNVRLTDASSIGLALPFTFTLEGQAITTVRLYADGFATLPATESVDSQPVGCLPLDSPARQAIYAWWTDLDPGAGGSVRTFRSTQGAFVMEFQDVPTGATVTSTYRVSFQIALYPDGVVKLLYRDAPETADRVVVGMEIND
ncbi:MAG: hypothetical protein D6790_04160, partial [Caldilineae bacterium]